VGWVVSIVIWATAVGMLCGGPCADAIGRRLAVGLGCALSVGGSVGIRACPFPAM
jgi:MFS family permease